MPAFAGMTAERAGDGREKADVVLIGVPKKLIVDGLSCAFNLHLIPKDAKDAEALIAEVAPRVRGAAVTGAPDSMTARLMARLPKLEFVSSFGVGYDNIDVKYAAEHGITVTNTPEVLNEEVADTALGLLLCTVREFPQAERYLRAGKWMQAAISADARRRLRDRTVGMVGMGRIGKAIARRLDGFGVPVVYHSRNPQAGVRLPPLSEARRHGARRRHADPDHAGRAVDPASGQRRGARCARARTASSSTCRAARWSTTRR